MKMTDDLADQLRNKLRNIISGYKINEDDAGWLEGLMAARLAATQQKGGGEVACHRWLRNGEPAAYGWTPGEPSEMQIQAQRRCNQQCGGSDLWQIEYAYKAPQPSIPAPAQQCWSCGETYTPEQRSAADGNCPACGVEIELFAAQKPAQQPAVVGDGVHSLPAEWRATAARHRSRGTGQSVAQANGYDMAANMLEAALTPAATPGEPEEYEFEVFQGGAWQAGGSAPDFETAQAEANHYAMMYGQDGPEVEVKFYARREVTPAQKEGNGNG